MPPGRLLKSQREQKAKARRERLRQERHVGHVRHSDPGGLVVVNPPGELKMSEVLEEFAEPFLVETKTLKMVQNSYYFAALAWNIGCAAPDQWDQQIDESLAKLLSGELLADFDEIRILLRAMVERKASHFGEIRRFVVEVIVTPSPAATTTLP